jgi:hypothetical protein
VSDYRWEWRTFARSPAYSALLPRATGEQPRVSRELYILSLASPHNVKIRDDQLDIKLLVSVDVSGLEQWRPLLKSVFPLDESAIDALWRAWGIPEPVVQRRTCTRAELVDEIVAPEAALRAVGIEKRRTRMKVEDCAGEYAALTIGGEEWETVAFEDVDPFRVWKAVRAVGLENAENTSYPAALKKILGLSAVEQSIKQEER